MQPIKVFSAGVAGKLARQAAAQFEAEHKAACELVVGGSVEGVSRLLGGERFDVMILADSSNIDQMMMPACADGYFVWAGNQMVVAGRDITSKNWKEKLLAPDARITHMNPFDDPSGYRAVMAMKLADRVEPGLSGRLLNHPNYHGLEPEQYAGGYKPPMKPEDGAYHICYRSVAVSMGEPFAELPPEMNLSDPNCEEIYRTASFQVGGGETVHGTAILHAIVLPKSAENRKGAEAFAQIFLANRFMMHGFTPVQKKVGTWDLKLPNMWDAESRYYSLMTLMEVEGTSKQLDCIPLEPDFVVLDCGCGPGRVAIQAAKRVRHVICLDSSEGMLEECRKNCAAAGVENVSFVLADWQETEIGKTIPEVDVVIQSRGGGGPSTLSMLRKAARRYAATVMWSDGAPCLPESRNKLFVGCYTEEDMERHPELRPFNRPAGPPDGRNGGKMFGARGPVSMDGKLPMAGPALVKALKDLGIEAHVTTVDEGWNRDFATKEEAYTWLLQLSRYPELVNQERFRQNVDAFLTPCEGGYRFFLPTQSDVTWFPTR